MPDIFVPLDTTYDSKYYQELRRNAVIRDFTLSFYG